MNLSSLLKFVVSMLMLVAVLFFVRWKALFAALAMARLPHYLCAMAMLVLTAYLTAMIFSAMLHRSGLERSVGTLFRINMVTYYYGLFLPTGISVDAVRWYKLTKNRTGRLLVFSVSFGSRIVLLGVILAFMLLVPFYNHDFGFRFVLMNSVNACAKAAMIIVLTVMLFFFSPRFNALVLRKLALVPIPERFRRLFTNRGDGLLLKDISAKKCVILVGLSIGLHLCGLIRVYLIVASLALPLSFPDIMWIGSFALVVQFMPITYSGVGLREGFYAFTFSQLGIPLESGVAVGLLLFSHLIALAVVGWALEMYSVGGRDMLPHDASIENTPDSFSRKQGRP